jgi:predicted DNA-binding ribbon-helix-helix protein
LVTLRAAILLWQTSGSASHAAFLGVMTVNTLIIKHSVVLNRHKTSVSLENEFWDGLREIAGGQHKSVSALVREIAQSDNKTNPNLSSSIRLFVLNYFRTRALQELNASSGNALPKLVITPGTW